LIGGLLYAPDQSAQSVMFAWYLMVLFISLNPAFHFQASGVRALLTPTTLGLLIACLTVFAF